MTRSQAYKILGLQSGATEAEIRKQFKKLAFKVHPDVNTSKNANEQFILITQAMELLMSDDVPHFHKEINDRQQQRQARKQETPEERDARMREAKMRFDQQKENKFRENRQYLEHLLTGRKWFIFKWINRVGIALAVILIFDMILPNHYQVDQLTAFSKSSYNGILYEKITPIELENDGIYFAKSNPGVWISSYPDVVVKRTWFLHTPVSFFSNDDFTSWETPFDFHIGSIRIALVIFLLFPLLTIIRRKKDLTFVFLYQLSFWGVGLVEIIILFTKNRFLHILSLGFL